MPQRLIDLFDVAKGHDLDLLGLDASSPEDPQAFAYVSRSARNNGVLAYVKRLDGLTPAAAGTLSLSVGGSVCATFLQPRPYYTAQNVRVLTPKNPMTDPEKLWWGMCIWHNRYRFNYGRHANRTFRDLMLPTTAPAWVRSAVLPNYSSLKDPVIARRIRPLDTPSWGAFPLATLFDVVRGRYVPAGDKTPGTTPEVSAMAHHNGIARYIDIPAEHPGNVISVARNGSWTGWAFLQPRPFFATDDVHVLYPRAEVPDAALLFVCTLIRSERYRFNYGRKWSLGKMRSSEIRLPVDGNGDVDWSAMARYVVRLRFSARALAPGLCHGSTG